MKTPLHQSYIDAEQTYSDLCHANRVAEFEHWTNHVLPKLAQLLVVDPHALGPSALELRPWRQET